MDTTPTPPFTPLSASSAKALEEVFGSRTPALVPSHLAAIAEGIHPLTNAETVEDAIKGVRETQEFEVIAQRKAVYPRNRLRAQHLVAFLIVNPFSTVGEICRFFAITPLTYKTIASSDSFKSMMEHYSDQLIRANAQEVQEKLKDTMDMAIDRVQQALVQPNCDAEFALAVLDKAGNRLGMGAAKQGTVANVNVNIVTREMIEQARNQRQQRIQPATIEGSASRVA